ncbi:hypothetical protein F2P46_32815 [Massilia sp. CCM 8734]|nr:hypothetical protein [Massilia sp. CCM 8734]
MGDPRAVFMEQARKLIVRTPGHPLRNLLDAEGKWLARFTWTKAGEVSPAIQAGHIKSRWVGGERLALQDAHTNQLEGNVVETQGGWIEREAVDIGGVPVEKDTAIMLEADPEMKIPQGTVAAAHPTKGWISGDKLGSGNSFGGLGGAGFVMFWAVVGFIADNVGFGLFMAAMASFVVGCRWVYTKLIGGVHWPAWPRVSPPPTAPRSSQTPSWTPPSQPMRGTTVPPHQQAPAEPFPPQPAPAPQHSAAPPPPSPAGPPPAEPFPWTQPFQPPAWSPPPEQHSGMQQVWEAGPAPAPAPSAPSPAAPLPPSMPEPTPPTRAPSPTPEPAVQSPSPTAPSPPPTAPSPPPTAPSPPPTAPSPPPPDYGGSGYTGGGGRGGGGGSTDSY